MRKKHYYILGLILLISLLAGCHSEPENTYQPYYQGPILVDDIVIFPQASTIIQLNIDTLGKNLPQSKDDGSLPVHMNLKMDSTSLETYGQIKVQGTSTSKWPKKNWSLSFYADEKRNDELRIQIGDSISSSKWITKAEWIDPSMLRNTLSFKLWESMIESRKTFPLYEVDYAWLGQDSIEGDRQTGAQGFPKTYPIEVKVNGEFYGLSVLLLGHDPANFNIDKDNPKHIYMEFDARGGYTKTKTWEKFSSDGIGEWIDGYFPKNDDFSQEQKDSIDQLGKLINGSQGYFENNFHKHLDKTNIIDMLLFLEVIYDYDAIAQDIEMVTYDLEKWYFLPWDKDTTFGMGWDGEGLREGSAQQILINPLKERDDQRIWLKTYRAFQEDIEARYGQLRDEGVFSQENLYLMARDINSKIPKELWEKEIAKWEKEGRPSIDETSTSQIISWFGERLEVLDKHFNYQ